MNNKKCPSNQGKGNQVWHQNAINKRFVKKSWYHFRNIFRRGNTVNHDHTRHVHDDVYPAGITNSRDDVPEHNNVPQDNVAVGNIKDSQTIVVGNHNHVEVGHAAQVPQLDPDNQKNQKNHAILRQAVKQFWVDGVLKSSLYNEVRIRLKLDEQPGAVENNPPWDLILKHPGQPDQPLDSHQAICDAYDKMEGKLLILGDPGGGKTTTLLMLAESLLNRASTDATHPTPVVFNLTSWQLGQTLADWLVEELNQRYQMPKPVSVNWVKDAELIPLLDGLDEVDPRRRDACVEAINTFHRYHRVSMVVCSRIHEYELLTDKLQLQGAITICPLTEVQIDRYITDLGTQGQTLADALAGDSELRELAQTPLMLSVMTFAHHGDDNSGDTANRSTTQRLFDRYIQRVFQHRDMAHLSSPEDTLHWLRWLARQMDNHSQTHFLIERLQPTWLCNPSLMNWYRLIVGLSGGLIFWLIFFSVSNPYLGFAMGLTAGGVGALSIWFNDKLSMYKQSEVTIQIELFASVLVAPIVALIFGWNGEPKDLFTYAFIGLLAGGSSFWVIFGPIDGIRAYEKFNFSVKNGLCMALLFSLVSALIFGLIFGLIKWLDADAQDGWATGFDFALSGGLIGFLFGGIIGGLQSKEAKLRTKPNQGMWQSFRSGIIVEVVVGVIFFLLFARLGGPVFGEMEGVNGGLIVALLFGMRFGQRSCLQHFTLRCLLYQEGHIPWNYACFLDYAAARLLLRKVGGGYVFVHRTVMEHISVLTDDDIARITAEPQQ